MATLHPHRCGSQHNTIAQRERHQLRTLMIPSPEEVTRGDGKVQLVRVQRCAVLASLQANTVAGQIKNWAGTEAGLKDRRKMLEALRLGTVETT